MFIFIFYMKYACVMWKTGLYKSSQCLFMTIEQKYNNKLDAHCCFLGQKFRQLGVYSSFIFFTYAPIF